MDIFVDRLCRRQPSAGQAMHDVDRAPRPTVFGQQT
jgi:hypothetical protein